MAKKIRFPLKLAEGAEVRNLNDLREHFDLEALLEYYKNGKLLTWLEDRYLEGEAEAVRALDAAAPDFQRKLCEVFQVEYTGNDVDMEEIERRQERLKRLRTIADDTEYIQNIDRVAFDQEELADLLDEGESRIYLCGEKFTVPASRKGISYIGIGNPAVHISGKVPENPEALGIEFRDVFCDNIPQAAVPPQVEQSVAAGGTLDLKLAELLGEEFEFKKSAKKMADKERHALRRDLLGMLESCNDFSKVHIIGDLKVPHRPYAAGELWRVTKDEFTETVTFVAASDKTKVVELNIGDIMNEALN